MSRRIPVCRADELLPGERRLIEVGRRSIGVFNVAGRFYAIRNSCPHQQAPLCKGKVSGTTMPSAVGQYVYGHEGEIIRCPWHKWEFNITTGRSVAVPDECKVAQYDVEIGSEDEASAVLERFEIELDAETVYVLV